MSKYELQNEVYKMVCNYYDNKHPNTPVKILSDYLSVIFQANAKDTKKAYNYWKGLEE